MINKVMQENQNNTVDALQENPGLFVEAHLKITDPETNEEIVNTRG